MTLALHWNFAEDKNLVGRAGPTLDFARSAAVGTYFDSDGVMQTAAADTPRFGHNPLTLESLGLLIERERTNLCLQSGFAATWTDFGGSLAPGPTTAPDGSTPLVITDDDGANGQVYAAQSIAAISTSTRYVYSVYLKKKTFITWADLRVVNQAALTIDAYFDLDNVAVGTLSADCDSAGIQELLNGWYRCWIAFTSDAADTTPTLRVNMASADSSRTITKNGANSMYMWGAQLELGEYPTSLIETLTTALTSGADICNHAAIGEYYHLLEGSMYVAAYPNVEWDDAANTTKNLCEFSNNAATFRYFNYIGGNGRPVTSTAFITTLQCALTVDEQASPLSIMRIASSQKVNDVMMFAQGATSLRDTVATAPASITDLNIGSRYDETLFADAYISEFRYYNEHLPDAILEDMSNGVFYQDTIASNGTGILNDGMVSVVHVAADYAGDDGDVFINGTRHTSAGLMYVGLLGPGSEDTVWINGILHTHSGIRLVRMSGSGDDWPEGFNTDSDGYQLTDTTVGTSFYVRGIARKAGGDMPITF